MIKLKNKKLLIIGAGGHAKVILDTLFLNKERHYCCFLMKKSLLMKYLEIKHI